MKYFSIVILFLVLSFATFSQDCKDLPVTFRSYSEALEKVKASTFLFSDNLNCSKSSWVHSASYFSCDGKTGYFILKTKEDREYIHRGMPIVVWREFKKANSYGSYYNSQIRDRYQMRL